MKQVGTSGLVGIGVGALTGGVIHSTASATKVLHRAVKTKLEAVQLKAALDPVIKDSPVLERLRQQKPQAFDDFTPKTVELLKIPVKRVKTEGIADQGYTKPFAPQISAAEEEAIESLKRAAAKHGQGKEPAQVREPNGCCAHPTASSMRSFLKIGDCCLRKKKRP
jgi:hypothetical protein